jgi:DNA replication protein DnaC
MSPVMSPLEIDPARLPLLLHELRLPAVARLWSEFAARADREGWPAARFLSALAEIEVAERARRRIERHLIEAHLPPGKTLESFDFTAVPMVSKAQVMALAAGDTWLEKGSNLLVFGPPGCGKSHLSAALGRALVENGHRVLFARTTDLVQKLQAARQSLQLEAAISKLDKYHLLVLDDLAYVRKDQAETSVLFELIAARYERRSLLITANQPFGDWDRVFPDPAMTVAAIDRLVHHAVIFEMNVESYRRRTALARQSSDTSAATGRARRAARATAASDNPQDHAGEANPLPATQDSDTVNNARS